MARTAHVDRVNRTGGSGDGASKVTLSLPDSNYVSTETETNGAISALDTQLKTTTDTAGAAATTVVTTKGDLRTFYGTGPARFPVGADATVLTANSAAPYGFVWAAAGGGNDALSLEVTQTAASGATSKEFTFTVKDGASTLEEANNIVVDFLFDDSGGGTYTHMAEDVQLKWGASSAGSGVKLVGPVSMGPCINTVLTTAADGTLVWTHDDNAGGLEDKAVLFRAAVQKTGYPLEYRLYGPFTVNASA